MNDFTKHGQCRAQQRCLPPIVHQWLDHYGKETYDGHGAIIVSFTHQSTRAMERDLGRHFVRQNRKFLHAYRVERNSDGAIVTAGWRTKRLNRP